ISRNEQDLAVLFVPRIAVELLDLSTNRQILESGNFGRKDPGAERKQQKNGRQVGLNFPGPGFGNGQLQNDVDHNSGQADCDPWNWDLRWLMLNPPVDRLCQDGPEP